MLDSDRDRAAGALFHILRAATKPTNPEREKAVATIAAAFQARAAAMLEEMLMDAEAERYLWERQFG